MIGRTKTPLSLMTDDPGINQESVAGNQFIDQSQLSIPTVENLLKDYSTIGDDLSKNMDFMTDNEKDLNLKETKIEIP